MNYNIMMTRPFFNASQQKCQKTVKRIGYLMFPKIKPTGHSETHNIRIPTMSSRETVTIFVMLPCKL